MRPALLLFLALLGAGCGQAAPSELAGPETNRLGVWIPDPGATLARSDQSSLGNPIFIVVNTAGSWSDLWGRAWAETQPVPALPQLDFVLTSVVVVGLGRRAGLGYAVNIDSIVVRTTGAVLFATEFDPGPHCNAFGTAAPVHMVRFPGHPPIIDWQLATATRDCVP